MVGRRDRSLFFVLILGFVGFVTSFGAHVVAVNLPTYAEQVGVGVAVIGLLIAVYDMAEIVAKPLSGALADRRGMKQTMLAGIALFVLASLAYPWIDARLLLLVRFMQGVGAAALSAVSLALVATYAGEQRGRAYGIYNAIKGAGYVVSPLVGAAIIIGSDFAAIFLATAAIGVVAFVLSLRLPQPEVDSKEALDDDDDDFSLRGLIAVFREPVLWRWYLVTVVNMFFVGILFGFLPVRVYALNYSALINGVILSAVAASYLVIQPLAGSLADRWDPRRTIVAGLALAGVCIIAIPFVSGPLLLLFAILASFGVGTVWTNTDTLISGLAREGQLGSTMGAAGSFKELGDMLGPLLIGVISQAFGLRVGFVLCGCLGLLSLGLIHLQPRSSRKRLG